jgi:pimeloyl-ACP methyl ester carboxylesterase
MGACAMLLAAASMHPAQAAGSQLVSLQTPRGASQAFLLITPERPVAGVVLFAGGHGALGLGSASAMRWGSGNFLVRTRDQFAAHGFIVAVIDAPSDRSSGMSAVFRMSEAHAGDIAAVASYLKQRSAVPIWLVGTSMGTFSAAAGAIYATNIDGLVLTSTITRAKPHWKIAGSNPDGVASMALPRIKVPTLILAHRKDACDVTPASDVAKLKRRLTNARALEIVELDGGDPPQSEPCEAKSQHGFLGIESEAVDAIAGFIKAHGKGGG